MKLRLQLLFIPLLLSSISFAQSPTEESLALQRSLIEANKFFLLEDYDQARKSYGEVLDKDEKNSTAYFGVSRIYLREKDVANAEKYAKLAVQHDDQNTWYYEHLIKIKKRQRDYESLIPIYQKLLSIEESEQYQFELADAYDRTKDYKKALKVLEEMEGDKVDPAITYRKARTYSKLNKPKKALKEYERLINSDPGETRYLHLLANHHRATGEKAKAVATYEKILSIDPDDSKAGLAIANEKKLSGSDMLYLESIRKIISSPSIDVNTKVRELIPFVQKMSESPDKALLEKLGEYSEMIISLHPDEAKVYALSGDIENIKGNAMMALNQYQKSLERTKTVYSVWEQYLYLLSDNRQYELMIEAVEDALDYFPNRGRLYFLKGMAHTELNDFQSAERSLAQALLMSGRDVRLKFETLALQGKVFYQLDDKRSSDAAFDNALSLNAQSKDVLSTYAYFLAEDDRKLDQALNMAERAYAISDDDASCTLAYAWALSRNNELSKALSVIEGGLQSAGGQGAKYLERYGDILFLNEQTDQAIVQWEKALMLRPGNLTLENKIKNRTLIK